MGSPNGQETVLNEERCHMYHERLVEIVKDIQKRLTDGQYEEPLMTSTEGRSRILDLPKDIADNSRRELLYTSGDGEMKIIVMNFSELQRLNLHALRKRLAAKVFDIIETKSLNNVEALRVQKLMSDYCSALRDYDYMKEKYTVDRGTDPFYLVGDKKSDWAIISEIQKNPKLLDFVCNGATIDKILLTYLDKSDKLLMGGGRGWKKDKKNRTDFFRRFWFGLAGGFALIAPMLIIILHNDRTTAVTTASVATILFALALAGYHGSDASPLSVIGTTAGYAAVLVVLVSTALQ